MSKFDELRSKNKFWWFLLLVPAIAVFVFKLVMNGNVEKAKEQLVEVQEGDFDLEKEQKEAEELAKRLLKESESHGKKAEQHEANSKKEDSDLNWHKK